MRLSQNRSVQDFPKASNTPLRRAHAFTSASSNLAALMTKATEALLVHPNPRNFDTSRLARASIHPQTLSVFRVSPLCSRGMEAAFFDLDKTVIARASMLALGSRLFEEGLINRRTVARSLYAQGVYRYLGANEKRLLHLQETVLDVTKGWNQGVVTRVVTEALGDIIAPLIYQEALELIQFHQNQGREVYLVSASPHEIVGTLANYLGVTGSIATRPRVTEEGNYTGEIEFYAYGPYKVQAIKELAESRNIDLDRSYAYSDSYTDVPMLESVGNPVAVNPDRVLARIARERNWEIMEFTETMRVTRSHLRSFLTVAVATAAVAAIGTLAPILRHRQNVLSRRESHEPSLPRKLRARQGQP